MQYKDYYQILGLGRDASAEEIKKAYRRLARKYHPDVSKEAHAEERFKEITEAHEVLRDAEMRAAYDQLGSNWQAGQEFRPPPGWQGRPFGAGTGRAGPRADFSDFFDSLFGGLGGMGGMGGMGGRGEGFAGMGGFRPSGGEHQTLSLEISLEEAYHGGSRSLHVQVPEQDASGRLSTRTRTLNVKIPAGVNNGQKIRLAGQGSPGLGGRPSGDLYLEIKLRPHPLYTLQGTDIHLEVPLAPWEAALGCKIEVPTLGGAVTLSIPPGAQNGQKLRLRGRGLPGQPAGDQFAVLRIVNPPVDSEQARDCFRRLAQELPFDPRAAWRRA